ncbi:hypothetical protein KPH14_005761 [Odynerus spinipes]|uniref:Uncharacterized protein n=1 Tax=Odynerus spinipes TaxID=1348599 RepID=A0AAD9RBQ4_9HYME|nr:hypothetical protein KPH14_005761 [Odynerus spinipes]
MGARSVPSSLKNRILVMSAYSGSRRRVVRQARYTLSNKEPVARSILPRGTRNILGTYTRHQLTDSNLIFSGFERTEAETNMKFVFTCGIFLLIVSQTFATIDDNERNVFPLNFPYGRGLDNELQLARLLASMPRLCYPKRNSEIINTLLGLPKNMNNAGK